jgi:hypothetical protein
LKLRFRTAAPGSPGAAEGGGAPLIYFSTE